MIPRALAALLLSASLITLGCGHAAMRGSVVMKINDSDAHICMGSGEISVGDEVVLIRRDCRTDGGKPIPNPDACKRVVMGQGEVVEVLNDHYSVARFPPGTQFKEGDTVEKAPK